MKVLFRGGRDGDRVHDVPRENLIAGRRYRIVPMPTQDEIRMRMQALVAPLPRRPYSAHVKVEIYICREIVFPDGSLRFWFELDRGAS